MAVDLLSKQGGTATLQDLLFRLFSNLDQTAVAQFETMRCKFVAFDAVAATDETSPSNPTRAKPPPFSKPPSPSFFHSHPNSRIAVRNYALQVRRIRCSRRTVYLLSKQGGTPTMPLMKPRPNPNSRKTSFSVLLPFSSKQQNRSSKLCAASSLHSMQQTDGLLVVEARRDTNHTVRSCALQDPLLCLSSFLDGAATMLFEVVHCKMTGNKLAASDSTVHLERE